MTYNEDFIPVEDIQAVEEPTYPVAFGLEITPKVQGIAIALLGLVGAYFLYTRIVQPVQEQQQAIQERVDNKDAIITNEGGRRTRLENANEALEQALAQREAAYSLLGDSSSLDTLLLDINQVIRTSNATIDQAIANDFTTLDAGQLAALGLTPEQIERRRTDFAENPARQRALYTSELWQYTPNNAVSGVIQDELLYGPELTGRLERQVVDVSLRSLFAQAQTIVRNLERLEPLLIIRDFEQRWAPIEGVEDLPRGITRPLETSFTLEVLVPVGDPRELPTVPDPAEATEGEEGAEGEATDGAEGGS